MHFPQTDIYNTTMYVAQRYTGQEVTLLPYMGSDAIVAYLNHTDRVNVVAHSPILHSTGECYKARDVIIGWSLPISIIECEEFEEMRSCHC